MRLVSPVQTEPPTAVTRYLLPQERSVIALRMHPAAIAGPLALAGAGLVAARKLASRSARPDIARGAYLLIPLYLLGRVAAWPTTYLAVTDQRIVLVRGLLSRTAAAMPLDQVTGLTLRRTVAGRLFDYGTLRFSCPGRRQAFRKISYLPYPEQLYLEIAGQVRREEADGTAGPAYRGEQTTDY